MRFISFLLFSCLTLTVAFKSAAQGKKTFTVRAGQSARQVNNHPYSYTSPGYGSSNCSGTGTVNGTATDTGYGNTNISGTVNTTTNCNSTYTPPHTTTGNVVTVDNASWVTDVVTDDQYLIQCTAHWRGSHCSYLTGGLYKAELEGNEIWITGMKGMKESKAKYHVVRFIPGSHSQITQTASPASNPEVTHATASPTSVQDKVAWTQEETYSWLTYKPLGPEDKDYVRVFCAANPRGAALVPRAKITAGQSAEHSIDCESWLSAKEKSQ